MGSPFISKYAAAGVAVALIASQALSAGFSIYESSASGMALGGAVVGQAVDASTIAYNPAAMSDLPGLQVMAGFAAINAFGDINSAGGVSTKLHDQVFWVPHIYASWQMSDRFWFGYGQYTEFGLGTQYSKNWPMAYSSIATEVKTTTFNPNLAYKVLDNLTIDIGLRLMWLTFDENAAPFNNITGPAAPHFKASQGSIVDVDADSLAYGWNAAAKYDLTDEWGFGFVYRSPTWVDADGDVDAGGPGFVGGHQYSRASANLKLPAAYTVGANYNPTECAWSFGAAVTYTEWSSYNALNIDLAQPLRTTAMGGASPITRIYSDKEWEDVFRFGFGAQYKLNDNWALRAGYVYDLDPINQDYADTMMLTGDRHIFGLGVGYTWKNFTIDVTYNYLLLMGSESVVVGKFDGQANGMLSQRNVAETDNMGAHMGGITLGYKF